MNFCRPFEEVNSQAIIDYLLYFCRMEQEFAARIKEKESESLKLKAKVKMCELKTNKLEAEIVHVDRESGKLRALCEDLMKN